MQRAGGTWRKAATRRAEIVIHAGIVQKIGAVEHKRLIVRRDQDSYQ
jgi:hypothetical protein